MGISRQGIHGNYRKKVGNVVARLVRGRVILSIYQPEVSNPNTAKQQTQRSSFVNKIRALNAFAGWAHSHARDWYSVGTGWSNFLKKNWTNFINSGGINYDTLVISEGNLLLPVNPSAAVEAGMLTVSFGDNSGQGNATANDMATILVYNSAKDLVIYADDLAKRSERVATISLPGAWAGDNVEVYLVMHSATDSSLWSDGAYIGSVSI